jgi:hypothetical protein
MKSGENMPRYFNPNPNPILYNSNGQTADGFSWFVSEETEQVKAALSRQDIFRIDSDGNVVYDSIEESDEKSGSDDKESSDSTSKKNSRK